MPISYNYGNGIHIQSSSLDISGSIISSSTQFILETTGSKGTKFQIRIPSGSTGEDKDTVALFITSSGKNPFLGVGTQDPRSTLDIKDVEDSSLGTKFLLQSARTDTLGAQVGDSAGSIFFSIDSGSYNDPFTTGSVASISSKVTSREDTDNGANVAGNIIFNSSPEWIETLLNVAEIGFFSRPGIIPSNEDSSAGMYISGALIVGGENSSQGDLRPFEVFGRDNSDGTNPAARYLQLSQESNTFTLYSSSLQVGSGSIFIGETYSGANSVEFVNLRGSNNIKLGHISGGGGSHGIEFYTNNSQKAILNTFGNFGIGTTTPSSKLEVVGDTILSGSLVVSQSFTASGLNYPDIDGTDGQVVTTDGAGNLSFQTIEDIYVTVKNVSGGDLVKGTPVHATSSQASGNATPVIAALASNASTMPATFVINDTLIGDGDEGQALLSGFIQGVNTSAFEIGEVVYVGENGGFTNVKPTGSNNLIQNLGIVTKIHATNGSGWIYGSGRSNDVPNLPTGKIWVGSDSYTVTSSVLSLDETNKYLSGSESAKFKLDTYEFGYNAFQGFGFDVTGSGIIISSSLPSEHYPMLKIGETELIDLTPNAALSNHTFAIHNVDNFQVSSGSEPIETSTNKLFEHTGEAFKIYSKGNTQTILNASSASIDLRGSRLNLLPDSGVTNIKISNSSTTPQYVPVFSSIPNSPAGAELTYVTSSTFTGGGGSSPYNLGTFGGRYSWGSADDNERIAHGFVNGPSAGATQNSGEWGTTIIGTPDSTTFNISNYLIQYHGIWCPVGGTPHIKAWGRSSDADFTTSTSMSVSLWSLDSEPSNGFGSSNVTLRAQTSFLQGQGSTVNYLGNGWETSGSIRPANCFYFVTFDLAGEIVAPAILSANFTIWID